MNIDDTIVAATHNAIYKATDSAPSKVIYNATLDAIMKVTLTATWNTTWSALKEIVR